VTYNKQDVLDVIEDLVCTTKGNIYKDGTFCIYKLNSTLTIEMPGGIRHPIKSIIFDDIDLSDEELKYYAPWYSDCVKEIKHVYNKYKYISPSKYFV
jgi:hypothetical protein